MELTVQLAQSAQQEPLVLLAQLVRRVFKVSKVFRVSLATQVPLVHKETLAPRVRIRPLSVLRAQLGQRVLLEPTVQMVQMVLLEHRATLALKE
jgi:hypothetical protein